VDKIFRKVTGDAQPGIFSSEEDNQQLQSGASNKGLGFKKISKEEAKMMPFQALYGYEPRKSKDLSTF